MKKIRKTKGQLDAVKLKSLDDINSLYQKLEKVNQQIEDKTTRTYAMNEILAKLTTLEESW